MAQTQLDYKFGADNSIYDVKDKASVDMSRFNFSRKLMTTIDNGGLYPVDLFRVFPRDKVKLSIRYLLDTFPLSVPIMTNYKIRTYWFYCKNSSLWKGWETFITKGRSGTIELTIPTLDYASPRVSSLTHEPFPGSSRFNDITATNYLYQHNISDFVDYISYSTPMSLSCHLGLPPKYYDSTLRSSFLPFVVFSASGSEVFVTDFSTPSRVNALPFMMYAKIYRFSFLVANLLDKNKIWFPDDLSEEWRISYSSDNLKTNGIFTLVSRDLSDHEVASTTPTVSDTCVDLLQLRYDSFDKGYFETSKPWLVRGQEETLDTDISDLVASLDFQPSVSNLGIVNKENIQLGYNSDTDPYITTSGSSGSNLIARALNRARVNFSGSAHSTLTLNALRSLMAFSVLKERNTLTNGSYNAFQQVQWRNNPKSPDYEPYYLGGSSDSVAFSQVIQTSQGDTSRPLGSQAGQGSSNGKSYIFDFDVPDYGYIMGLMSVVPEPIYSQGIDRIWTELTADELFIPTLANLGYQPVLNKEIYYSSDEHDDLPFGYQTRYAYLKARQNKVSGMFILPPDKDRYFSAFVQTRFFSSLPSLSLQFCTADFNSLRRDFLNFESQPAYRLQFASDVDLVRALPYQSTPETFGF